MSRVPTIGAMEQLFCERWGRTGGDLTAIMRELRDMVLVGAPRARARASLVERRRRSGRLSAPHVRLAAASVPLLRSVARAAGVEVTEILGQDRTRTASRARFEAMWILRRARKMSYEEIGAVVGGRDHSVAHRAVKLVDQRVAEEPELAARLRRIGKRAA